MERGIEVYFLGWIALILVGLAAALWSFFWALDSGQLKEQRRARFLPLLSENGRGEVVARRKPALGPYFLLFVGLLWFTAMVTCLFMTLGAEGTIIDALF